MFKAEPACCGAMNKALEDDVIVIYPPEKAETEPTWAVNGCCGSCHVINSIQHCPFCGVDLSRLEVKHV